MTGQPGGEQQRVYAALAVPEHRQPGPVGLRLPGQEVQRGDGLLLIRPDPGPPGIRGIPAPSGLAAAQLVIAQAGDPVGRQPAGHRRQRVAVRLTRGVVVAVGRRPAAP